LSNVAYIKQKAIEIANNSSHKIIIGVMNQKDVEADCSFDNVDCFSESEYSYMDSFLSTNPNYFNRRSRDERNDARMKRKADRIQRRMNRINKL